MSKKQHHHQARPADLRRHKQQQFQAPQKRARIPIPFLVLVLGFGAAAIFALFRSTEAGAEHFNTLAPGQDVRIPLADVNDGRARFYRYPVAAAGTVDFFVIQSSDGVVRAAFDACDVCFWARRGYRQAGDDMICNKCRRSFPSVSVNEVKGGCNPAPLRRTVEGDHLVIRAADIQAGSHYF